MAKIKIVDVETVPLCPHCSHELTTIERVQKGWIEQIMIFLCPFCKKVISIGYNLGY